MQSSCSSRVRADSQGLKGSALTVLELGNNHLGVEGAEAIGAVIKDTKLSELQCAASRSQEHRARCEPKTHRESARGESSRRKGERGDGRSRKPKRA